MNILFRFYIVALFCSSSLLHGMQDGRQIKKRKIEESEEKMKKDLLAYRDGDGNTIVHQLAKSDKELEKIEALFKKSGDFKALVDVKNAAGLLPVTFAFIQGAHEIGAYLIAEQNADASSGLYNLRFSDDKKLLSENRTLLHVLVVNDKRDSVRLLIEFLEAIRNNPHVPSEFYSAFINCRDSFGKTALHYACELGHEEIANFLLSAGSSYEVQDQYGELPIHLALRRGDFKGRQIARRIVKNSFRNMRRASIPGSQMQINVICALIAASVALMLNSPNRDGVTPSQMMPSLLRELMYHNIDASFICIV